MIDIRRYILMPYLWRTCTRPALTSMVSATSAAKKTKNWSPPSHLQYETFLLQQLWFVWLVIRLITHTSIWALCIWVLFLITRAKSPLMFTNLGSNLPTIFLPASSVTKASAAPPATTHSFPYQTTSTTRY